MSWSFDAPSGVTFGSERYATLKKSNYRMNAYFSTARGTGTTYYVKIRATASRGDTWGGTRNFHFYAAGSWYNNVSFAENQSRTLYYTGSGGDADSGLSIRAAVSDQNSNTPSGGNSAVIDDLYVSPVQSWTVSFDANGGTGTTPNQKKVSGQSLTIQGNSFTRERYNFVTWNTDAAGTGTNYPPGSSYTTDAALTLYAQWEKATIPVYVTPDGVNVYEADMAYINIGGQIKEADIYINIGGQIYLIS